MAIKIEITSNTPFIVLVANTNFLADCMVDNNDPASQLEDLEHMFESGEFTIDEIKQYISDRKRKAK